jgi:Tfp pilus assembly protein PilV
MLAQTKGFSILEALVSLLLFSVAILGTVNLMGTMFTNQSKNVFRNDSSMLTEEIIGYAVADSTNINCYTTAAAGCTSTVALTAYQQWEDKVDDLLPNTVVNITFDSVSRLLDVTLTWNRADGVVHNAHIITAIH